jgi:hypothetical protein
VMASSICIFFSLIDWRTDGNVAAIQECSIFAGKNQNDPGRPVAFSIF